MRPLCACVSSQRVDSNSSRAFIDRFGADVMPVFRPADPA
jgi:hypothetical protein